MKKIATLFSALFFAVAGFNAFASPDDPDQEAVVTHIDKYMFKITWEDYRYVNPYGVHEGFDTPDAYVEDAYGVQTDLTWQRLKGINSPIYFDMDAAVNYFIVNLSPSVIGTTLRDGTYTLFLPEYYVQLVPYGTNVTWEYNLAQYLELTIGDVEQKEYTPSFTELPAGQNYFSIYWDGVDILTEGNTTGAYMVNQETNENYELKFLEDYMYSKANLRIEANRLAVNLTNNYPYLPDGTYKMYIPANYVLFNNTTQGNAAIDGYEFTYVAPWMEGPVEFEGPSEDGIITVTWTAASSLRYNNAYAGDGYNTTGVMIWDNDGDAIQVPYPKNISFNGNVMTVNLNGIKFATGECKLDIPEDCIYVTVDGEEDLTYGVSYIFNWGEPSTPSTPSYEMYSGQAEWSITENMTVKKGTLIEISWGGNQIIRNPYNFDPVNVYAPIDVGGLDLDFGEEVTISEDGTKLVLDLGGLPTQTYRINIPEGFVLITVGDKQYINMGSSLDDIFLDNRQSGVGVIGADDVAAPVYNLQGVRVLENASDLNTLPRGIYIVGGKKVVR